MNFNDINYIDYGNQKGETIVLLHGWAQNIEMMNMLGAPFAKNFRILVLDLPGFGKTPEPEKSWDIDDYTDFLYNFLKKLKIVNPILVGHSFGGRIAICYASKYKTKKIVLLSAPFRPQKKKISLMTRIFKVAKKIKFLNGFADYMRKKIGSEDYNNASLINRGSLVKIVNQDLTENARKIKCPSLLIYGTNDEAVLYSEAEELSKLIKDSGLVAYEDKTHYAYLEDLNRTISILKAFFIEKGDK